MDTTVARRYHNATKHSVQSVRTNRHVLDWDNRPLPYKIYTTLEPIPLPEELPPLDMPALEAIAVTGVRGDGGVDLATIARLCFLSNGITRRLHRGDPATNSGLIEFRATATTGALYHMENYVVCGDLPGLSAGVYHYGAHDNSLRQLRAGDYRRVLVEATGSEPTVREAPAMFITTSTFWRNAWKYQARAYRHTFWDTGTMLANTLAVAAAGDVSAKLVLGFADAVANRLLDIDGEKEAAVALLALGRGSDAPKSSPAISPLNLPTERLSRYEIEFPLIQEMHAASSLSSGNAAAAWRGQPPRVALPEPQGKLIPLDPLDDDLPEDSIETVIRRRGSTRRFSHDPISFQHLSTMLDRAVHGINADCLDPDTGLLNQPYLIVNNVEELAPGAYVARPQGRALELLGEIDQNTARAMAGRLALGQELGADAAVNVYFLVNLERVLERFGDRGYRVAQLEAAITAGRLYLAAYSLRLGATGLTFFDDDVITFFSPHAAGKSVMFLIALGVPAKRRPGR